MQLQHSEAGQELIKALQEATRDLLAVALQSLECVKGIRLQHMRLMIAVHEHPGAASVTLSDTLGISPSSVTRQADRLCETGYLTRTQHPQSRRVVVLTLTSKGEETVAAVLAYRANLFARALPGIKPEHWAALTNGLTELHVALRDSRQQPADA